ncbi:hypothetical protein AXG93_2931s1260 [Marchantia polymorpha subsp. ruderalis]|uniref:peptidylprolyl isomerase n=1 Tax=Marchantia polymorpha subsp. ruderalis TaxID=1480154 RepID=A0A176VWV3_MARPO|nr:hypothetical protein AXG93_2931s1260 [Marchantia polymorpha subsp. ruderalis]
MNEARHWPGLNGSEAVSAVWLFPAERACCWQRKAQGTSGRCLRRRQRQGPFGSFGSSPAKSMLLAKEGRVQADVGGSVVDSGRREALLNRFCSARGFGVRGSGSEAFVGSRGFSVESLCGRFLGRLDWRARRSAFVSFEDEGFGTRFIPEGVEGTTTTSQLTGAAQLYVKHAPKTCRNFIELSRRGYYEDVRFHRVIKDFMAQTGDPTNTGRGGESIYGAKFEDEIHRDLKHTGAGILSMANSGPNTNGSQFFLTLAPTPWLDGKHTIFGRVCRGMEVLKRLGNVQTDKNDRPVHDVKITRAYVQD